MKTYVVIHSAFLKRLNNEDLNQNDELFNLWNDLKDPYKFRGLNILVEGLVLDCSNDKVSNSDKFISMLARKSFDVSGRIESCASDVIKDKLSGLKPQIDGKFLSIINLTDLSNDECSHLQENIGHLYLNCTNINLSLRFVNAIKKINGQQELVSKRVNSVNPSPRNFHDWSCFSEFKHPLTDVLIHDNYILINQKGQKIEDNLIPFLKRIVGSQKNTINLTIVTWEFSGTDFESIDDMDLENCKYSIDNESEDEGDESVSKVNTTISLDKMARSLNELFLLNGMTNLNLQLFRNKGIVKGRVLYTNYIKMSSQQSFTFFNEIGNPHQSVAHISYFTDMERSLVPNHALKKINGKISGINIDANKYPYHNELLIIKHDQVYPKRDEQLFII